MPDAPIKPDELAKVEEVNKPKRTFWSDIWRKIVAVILAIGTLLVLKDRIFTPIVINHVPVYINCDNTPGSGQSKVILEQKKVYVDITVSSWLDVKLTPGDFQLVLPFNVKEELKSDFNVSLECSGNMVHSKPWFVSVLSFNPQVINVSGDIIGSKNVRVRPNYTLPPQDRRTPRFVVEPEMVKISGPSRSLPKVEDVFTESIDLQPGRSMNFDVEVALADPLNPQVKLTDVRSVKVSVIYDQSGQEVPLEQKHWDVPVLVLNNYPARVEIQEKKQLTVDLVLKGLENYSENMTPHPYIDLSSIENTNEEIFVPVSLLEALPNGMTVEFQPPNIPLRLIRTDAAPAVPPASAVPPAEPVKPAEAAPQPKLGDEPPSAPAK